MIEDAIFHYQSGFAHVADACRWISVDKDQIGELPWGDGTEFRVFFHDSGGAEGGEFQDLGWRNAGLDVEFQFAM